ncbi:MAG: tRNA (N6-isopentenyl adenosine(37)-C2)-methylthiotransferase MiaB [Coriobacteriia bacterium]|nr:tRNA (N6-isopentenyl adenosine(37)-C2)-methylthiotransferase MiaB [Coriobacteriia bacterium]
MNQMKTFEVRTFGCQMNKHDSERIAGMLRARGLDPVAGSDPADVIVFNTCCVRENADERLYGQVSSLSGIRRERGTVIAVGGCIGQRDGAALLSQLPMIDVVFGTHNLARLPELIDAAAQAPRPVVEVREASDADFTADLPSDREHPWHAWVPIAVGCNNFCTYCIVPYVRGHERSREFDDIVDEVSRLTADGVVEVTLLGQNVNSYGRDLYGEPRFAALLRAVAATGIQRIRFTTSHPKDLSEETIAAMAETPQVCRHLHLPVQSGSDAVIARMNRHYTRESYLALVERLYAAMPDLALTTDLIVGFPGETEEDFEDTMQVVLAARYDQAFTFIYSPRDGTPAATMDDQIPKDVVQPRFDRLVGAVQAGALAKNTPLLGSVQRILVEGASKRDDRVLMGRTGGNKVVHAPAPESVSPADLAGSFVDVTITDAQTWFLMGTLNG